MLAELNFHVVEKKNEWRKNFGFLKLKIKRTKQFMHADHNYL